MKLSKEYEIPPHRVFDYSQRVRNTVGRCNNIVGTRTGSWCSHLVGALFYFYHVYNNIIIRQPTPIISRVFDNIVNCTNFIHQLNKKDINSVLDYITNVFNEEDYEEEQNYLSRHRFIRLPNAEQIN